ncbi:MAG TPA: NAD(P)/FAD-dependent oxidoreductase [Thermoanaerobaculia bacterium]|nr:NAD(P)/FAD-dependent oxidoreductase [Thermoanaerobaculia bacterium]
MKQYDLVVIGGGSTGLSVANRVSAAGRRVALVDKGPVGGLCSLAGCNPKKVFVRASEVLDEVHRAGDHGIRTGEITIDWEQVWQRKHGFTDTVTEATERGLASKGVERIAGVARFTSPDTLIAGGEELQANALVIATGSTPRRLTFPGGDLARTTDDVLELRRPPERMVIVGAGVVAFEFGFVFARLGTKVTILMRSSRALSGFDDDFAAHAVDFGRSIGIELLSETTVTAIRSSGDGAIVDLTYEGRSESREADFVLNAAGRVPAIDQLDLPTANVETWRRGVVVDDYLRSPSNRRVFAGGDAHGFFQLSPVASYEGRVIARNILEGDVAKADYSAVPQAIYTTPPLATVGWTETEARRSGLAVNVRTSDMKSWLVYAIAGEPVAWAKVVADAETGRILGAQLFGAGASENIHLFALAIRCGLTADDLREAVYAYPTFASTIQSAVP